MQLLYYIDDVSFLIDSGYDAPKTDENFFAWLGGSNWTRSSWNNYYDHNVMRDLYFEADEAWKGGLSPPYTKPKRIASEHAPVQYLTTTNHNKVDVLESLVTLNRNTSYSADYKRTLLLVGDPSHPYLIDFNTYFNQEIDGGLKPSIMLYHGNSSSVDSTNGWFRWNISNQPTSEEDLYAYLGSVEKNDTDLDYYTQSDSTKEYYKVPRQVEKLSISGGRYFTTIGIFQANDNIPGNNPKQVFSHSQFSGSRPHQAWYWKQDANTVDVIVKRSKVNMTQYNQDLDFDINGDGFTIPSILLPASKDYGFARFNKNSGIWKIDNSYQINLDRSAPIAAVSGPRILFEGQEGTWQASATGGVPPYSYTWFLRPEGSSSSSPIGTGSSISYTARDPFYISVEAEDAISKTGHSPAHLVKITGFYHKEMADSARVPDEFLANPNYPNPFNPTTTIKYGVPERADVTINVYNILGQNVATLVNETKSAGFYSARFDASRLASGFYIARI